MAAKRPEPKKRYPVEILTKQEVQALIQSCSRYAPTGIRNRALIVLLYRSGLRVSEALSLKPRDLDPDKGTVNVRDGKGHKPRIVGLDPGSFAYIDCWLNKRRSLGINGHAEIFCTLKGGKLSTHYVRDLLKRKGKQVGIEKRVHPHGLRHTHAAELAHEGFPMNLIQKQLGHSSLRTTTIYLDHIAPAELINSMRNREPLE